MLMEELGRKMAGKTITPPTLFSMNVTYISAAKEDIHINGTINYVDTEQTSTSIKLSKSNDGNMISEGILHWTQEPPKVKFTCHEVNAATKIP